MNAAETLIVKLLGDTSHYTNSLKHAEKATRDFQALVAKVGATQAQTDMRSWIWDKVQPVKQQEKFRIHNSLYNQRRQEEAKTAREQETSVQRRARVEASLSRQRLAEERKVARELNDIVQGRARVQMSLDRQRRSEEHAAYQLAIKRQRVQASLDAQKKAEHMGKFTTYTGHGFGSVGGISGVLSFLGKGMSSIVTGVVSGVTTAAVTAGINGLIGLFKMTAHAAWELTSTVFSLGAEFEKTAVSFEVMTGSAEKGKQVLDDLRKVAITSPYTFRQLSSPTQMLLGMGVATEDVIATVSRLGDVAAGSSERMNRLALAYGQVMAAGRFMGTELRQFTEAGVGVNDFATTMGVTAAKFRQMMTKGMIGPEVVTRTLERITSEGGRFANMNQRINKTVGGSYNALIETIEMGLGKAGISMFKSSGLADGIQSLAKMFRDQIPLIERWGTTFGKFLAPIVDNFQSILQFGSQLGQRVLTGIFGDLSGSENSVEKFSKVAITSFLGIEKAISLMLLRLEQLRLFAGNNMMVRGINAMMTMDERKQQKQLQEVQEAIRIKEDRIAGWRENDPNNPWIEKEEKNLIPLRNRQKTLLEALPVEFGGTKVPKEGGGDLKGAALEAKKLQDQIDAIKGMDINAIADQMIGKNNKLDKIRKGGGMNWLQGIVRSPMLALQVGIEKAREFIEGVQNEALRKPIEIPIKFDPTGGVKKLVDSIQDKIGKGFTDYEKIVIAGSGLNDYVNSEKSRLGPTISGVNRFNYLEDLRKAGMMGLIENKLKDRAELGFPSSARIGSSESADIVNRSIAASKDNRDIQGQIRDVMEELKTEMEEYYKKREIVDKELSEWLKKDPKILKVKGV